MPDLKTTVALMAWKNMKEFLEADTPKETLLQICQNNIAVLEAMEEE